MSSVQCWQCKKDYPQDQVLDIPVFGRDSDDDCFTIKWCLKCVQKQLKLTDYKLLKKTKKEIEKDFENLSKW